MSQLMFDICNSSFTTTTLYYRKYSDIKRGSGSSTDYCTNGMTGVEGMNFEQNDHIIMRNSLSKDSHPGQGERGSRQGWGNSNM